MVDFAPILQRAIARNGGEEALAARFAVATSASELQAVPDDRYFSLMSLRIFRAGLKHNLVDAKWPAFEEVFHGFAPQQVRAMSEEAIEDLLKDQRLIRHFGKLRAVHANAASFCALAERGGFGKYLADWSGADIVGLWEDLARNWLQMGGNSGPMFLRMAGKDTFVLSDSVVQALNHWGVFTGTPKGKGDRRRAQSLFNGWVEETGRPLCQLSLILAQSVD